MPRIFGFTRRGVLLLAGGAGIRFCSPLYAGEGTFWNKKDPAEWSPEEVEKLVTKSPWAKQVSAFTSGHGNDPYSPRDAGGGRSGGLGLPGAGTAPGGSVGTPDWGGGGIGGGRRGRGGEIPMDFSGVVRWASAKPVQQALKITLPASLADHYVISVSGIPILSESSRGPDRRDVGVAVSKAPTPEILDRIKQLTYLEPKGKSAAQPGVVQPGAGRPEDINTLWFGFSKEILALTPADKEVAFRTEIGRLEIKTKFNLRDMMYHKELAL